MVVSLQGRCSIPTEIQFLAIDLTSKLSAALGMSKEQLADRLSYPARNTFLPRTSIRHEVRRYLHYNPRLSDQ